MDRAKYLTTRVGSPADPYRALLGSSLIGLLDARLGVTLVGGEVDTWTDLVSGIVCSAPSAAERPTYNVDGSNWRGRRVVGLVDASSKRVGTTTATPNVLPAGSMPELFVVGRLTAFNAAAPKWFVRITDFTVTAGVIGFLVGGGNTLYGELSGTNVTVPYSSTAPHCWETLFDPSASGQRVLAEDGVALGTGAAGSTSVLEERVAIGSNGQAAGYVQDSLIAMIGVINPAPSAALRANLVALARADWGF